MTTAIVHLQTSASSVRCGAPMRTATKPGWDLGNVTVDTGVTCPGCLHSTKTAAEYRAEATAADQRAHDSFDRCDTDGCVSQWVDGLVAQQARANARIADNDGLAEFPALFDLEGNWVPARLIEGQYGPSWMLLDADGRRTGQYVNAFPKRRATIANKGYLEGRAMWPATAKFAGRGKGIGSLTSVRIVAAKTCPDTVPPVEVITADRWAD